MHPAHADVKLATLQAYGNAMGAQKLRALLASYSCPLNKEVESFLKDESRAVHSGKMSSSVTYLALDVATGDLLGYFTLMMEAYSVKAAELTSANRRLVKRSSELDAGGNLTTAVYLIAQLAKNYALPEERRISGAVLLELALTVFRRTKEAIGGKLVMVEREIDRPKLLDFYNDNGFNSVVLIPGNVYGEWDNFNLEEAHVIPALIRKYTEAADRGDPSVRAFGTGRPTRDFVYAGDVMATVPWFIRNYDSSEPVNISAGRRISIRELAEAVRDATGYRGEIVWDATQPDGQMDKIFDVTCLHSLGLSCDTPLSEGLRRTASWFRTARTTAQVRL